ncbi:MAG TPA: 2-oxo-4-hydroxy-4-carboxy-5-ureidoimidazoline decarboxylase [Pyrinomonadaceae bacterium]|nr:2-oxo-4-hydroxy-4-carboxy-5-ureidoimidazoline decarboxylase [Pyrinomonadaceae bacterium]
MTLDSLNALSEDDADAEFLKCCGSVVWARTLTASRPFASESELFAKADDACRSMTDEDWLEAFRAHPKIGEKKAASAQTQQEQNWSSQEQSAIQAASAETIRELAEHNYAYQAKFGFIFIVCASGKSSDEMLSMLKHRMQNDPLTELGVAAGEQRKITRLRLEKMLTP